jgi:DNA invertase Pin-like site-specific DNA recombinase
MFQITGDFAELQRSILKERIVASLARARDKGTRSGKSLDARALRPVSRRPTCQGLAA